MIAKIIPRSGFHLGAAYPALYDKLLKNDLVLTGIEGYLLP